MSDMQQQVIPNHGESKFIEAQRLYTQNFLYESSLDDLAKLLQNQIRVLLMDAKNNGHKKADDFVRQIDANINPYTGLSLTVPKPSLRPSLRR